MLVVNSGGIVKNTTITAKGGVDAKVLERLGNYLNLTFCDREVGAITNEFILAQKEIMPLPDEIMNPVMSFLSEVLQDFTGFDISADGQANILNYPEFKDVNRTKGFFDFVRNIDKNFLKEKIADDKINILIGDENPHLKDLGLSMVISNYKIKDGMIGGIAIVGPTRMDYSKVVATLDYLKKNLDKYLDGTDTR